MCKKSRETKILQQIELMEEIRRKADINMVTCAHCGSVMLHREFPIDGDVPDVECPYCDYKSEPNDFPDYYYEGMELSGEFKED